MKRSCQLALPFPAPTVINFPKPVPGWKVTLLARQPRVWPKGWHRLYEANPDNWREIYEADWSAKRAAAGLPSEVLHPIPTPKVTRKRA